MAKKLSQGAKAPKPECVRVNLSVGKEEYQRLFVHALMSGRSAGEIVTSLLQSGLKEFALPAKLSNHVDKSHRQASSDPVSNSAPPPALADAA